MTFLGSASARPPGTRSPAARDGDSRNIQASCGRGNARRESFPRGRVAALGETPYCGARSADAGCVGSARESSSPYHQYDSGDSGPPALPARGVSNASRRAVPRALLAAREKPERGQTVATAPLPTASSLWCGPAFSHQPTTASQSAAGALLPRPPNKLTSRGVACVRAVGRQRPPRRRHAGADHETSPDRLQTSLTVVGRWRPTARTQAAT